MLSWIAKRRLLKELKELRPLPLGRTEFEAWSDKIIELAAVPGATVESQKFALAEMILHVKASQSFETYGRFVHELRRGAACEVAVAMMKEIKDARNAKAEASKVLADGKI